MNRDAHGAARKYCARFCEENVWHLLQDPEFAACDRVVALISNLEAACLFWEQRAAVETGMPLWWDYHVILLVRQGAWQVYDFDTTLPFPADAATYLHRTFGPAMNCPPTMRPRFALFEGDAYRDVFASDRSHMRDENGVWHAPPPDWPPINPERGAGFLAFVHQQMAADTSLSLADMQSRFGTRPTGPTQIIRTETKVSQL